MKLASCAQLRQGTPRHPWHIEPSCLEIQGVLRIGELYLPGSGLAAIARHVMQLIRNPHVSCETASYDMVINICLVLRPGPGGAAVGRRGGAVKDESLKPVFNASGFSA